MAIRGNIDKLLVNVSVVFELFRKLWKLKLWWSFPIIFVLLITMTLLLVAGNTGVAALIYPLF